MDLSKTSCLVIDSGYFCEVAITLSKVCKKVYYSIPRESNFPANIRFGIGRGIPGIERVQKPEPYYDKVDWIVFPDIMDGETQAWLRKNGYTVFGSGPGDMIERDRPGFKKELKKHGLPTIPDQMAYGFDDLRNKLKNTRDKWIKISDLRGIGETFHHIDYASSEQWLFDKGAVLGPNRHDFPFMIEDSIDGVEVGADGFFANRKYLDKIMLGIEIKDKGYIGKVMKYSGLPPLIKEINDKLSPILAAGDVRCSTVTELRVVNDKLAYPIDATLRFASPPGALACNLWGNLPEMMYGMALNEDIPMKEIAKFGAEVIIYSKSAPVQPVAISFPKKIRDNVKIRNLCIVDGIYYFMNQDKGDIIASAVGVGDSKEAAEMEALHIAEQIKGDGIYYEEDVFDKADEQLKKLKKIGIEF